MRLSLLLVVKAALLIAVLLWAALGLARLIGTRIQYLALSPSIQTLASNLIRIALVFLALLIGLNTVGIDLTGVAVFSGAIGVGVGLGLQKIVSNFIRRHHSAVRALGKAGGRDRGRPRSWPRSPRSAPATHRCAAATARNT